MKSALLSYRERIVSLGLQLQLRAGELVNVEVRHAPDCDLLHGRGACSCTPAISANVRGRLYRVASDGFVFADESVSLN